MGLLQLLATKGKAESRLAATTLLNNNDRGKHDRFNAQLAQAIADKVADLKDAIEDAKDRRR